LSVVIFSLHESGAVDSWTWDATLSRNADASFTVELFQTALDGNQEDCLGPYRLSALTTGSELYDFLHSSWQDSHESSIDREDWASIVAEVAKLSPDLANGLREVLAQNMR
jgi:hypothetical protein